MDEEKDIVKKYYRTAKNPFTGQNKNLEIETSVTMSQLVGVFDKLGLGSVEDAERMLRAKAMEQLGVQEETFRLESALEWCKKNASEDIIVGEPDDSINGVITTPVLKFAESCQEPVALVCDGPHICGIFSDIFEIQKRKVISGEPHFGPGTIYEHFYIYIDSEKKVSFRVWSEKSQQLPELPVVSYDFNVLVYDEKNLMHCQVFKYHFEDFPAVNTYLNKKRRY